jgi:hypothetical protein
VAVVVVAFDGGVLDGAVHAFNLTIGPGMVGLGESMLNAVLAAYLVETVDTETRGPAVTILREIDGLDAVVGEDRVEMVGNGLEQSFEERYRGWSISLSMQLDKHELGGSVDGYEQMKLTFLGANLGDIDVEVADRVGLELDLLGLVSANIGQPTDAVARQAAVQC